MDDAGTQPFARRSRTVLTQKLRDQDRAFASLSPGVHATRASEGAVTAA